MAEWTDSMSSSDPIVNSEDGSTLYYPSSIISIDRSTLMSRNSLLVPPKSHKRSVSHDSTIQIRQDELKMSINSRIAPSDPWNDEHQFINYKDITKSSKTQTPITSRSISRRSSMSSITDRTVSESSYHERQIRTANPHVRQRVVSPPPKPSSYCCLLL
ncbi:hypothetical protein TRFO_06020 [Tritrichomonas foetus]|uniref:Uncharacterized protein n=1 Tax=Tritrichomonas foetus TaxID=1144522 RepID=A0A1J4K0T7_9EUKA|nr:hypothetical protein TRFO_06020 [Tritrichomonas foetus]|eukprot:OHT05041.1 hypothetical protein TRFO_06020 [Tritrichomonas foetus]